MGFLFGGGYNVSQTAPVIASLRVQTSAYGGAIPIVFGMTRIPANLMQYEDFTAIAHTTTQNSGGKGGGGSSSSTTYTYTALVLMRLAHGQIAGVPRVWKEKNQTTLAGLGFTFFDGSYAQSAFGALASRHPDRALAYRGLAYVAHDALDLGESASIGNLNFELKALKPYGGIDQVIREVRLQQGANPWNRVSSALVQSSPDKSSWTTIATISPPNDAALHAHAVGASTARPYWRLLANSNAIGWRGAWDSATVYAANDVVSHAGNQWLAVTPVTGTAPDFTQETGGGEGGAIGVITSGWTVMDAQAARWEVAALEFATATSGPDIAIPQMASSGGDWVS